jgi:hypothetical protein
MGKQGTGPGGRKVTNGSATVSAPQPVEIPFRIKQSSYRKVDAVQRWEARSSEAKFLISGRSGPTPIKR